MLDNDIQWISFYHELAEKLIAFKNNRSTLLTQLHEVFHRLGMPSPFIERTETMTDVDPFSVFGCFNKGLTNANRTKILTGFADVFGITATVPTSFDGIPTLNNLKAFFFAFRDHPKRGEHDIDNLWELFNVAISYADNPTADNKASFIKIYDVVKEQAEIRWNITMGLYWIRPYHYINLDDRNRRYLGMGKAFPPVDLSIAGNLKKVPSAAEYLDIIERCKVAMKHDLTQVKSFVELSHSAWLTTSGGSSDTDYWPPLKDYNPGITKEMWVSILQDETVTTTEALRLLNMFLQLGGESTFNNLVEKFGNQFYYKGTLQDFSSQVFKKVNCAPCPKEYIKFTQYIIPFVGRMAFENDVKRESWKLRDELKAALEEINSLGTTSAEEETMDTVTDVGLNTILYGPPGTGKTYHTVIYAVAIIENKKLEAVKAEASTSYKDVLNRYNEYKAQGRIEFTTFHQSYGYEEFIEGIKPLTDDSEKITYKVMPGIFKKFCEESVPTTKSFDDSWGELIDQAISQENKYDFTRRAGSVLHTELRNDETFTVYWSTGASSNTIKKARVYDQWVNNRYTEKAESHGGTRWNLEATQAIIDEMIQKYGLPENESVTEKKSNKVFIIDEINRGNISKIFGELITLIEESKRVGKAEGMKTLLPYSMKPFGVPENVYIIGTMNTADRSIATIDTALRRRFEFTEMLPDPRVVAKISVGNLSIENLLTKMNRRITVLYDREHTIGHAYFMPLKDDNSIKKLAEIFKNKVIPLLQEYFYEDYEKIRLVLGDNQKNEQDQFIQRTPIKHNDLFGSADVGIDEGYTYKINKAAFMNPEAYRLI